MSYLKKPIDMEAIRAARENLSTRDEKFSPEPVCDWCADGVPVYVYAATHLTSGEQAQCWRWMACGKCNRLIENGNWDAIERHVTARFKSLFALRLQNQFPQGVPDSLVGEAIRRALKDFHDYAIHVTGTGGGKTGNQ